MKVGFYDQKTHSMVAVEPWTEDIQAARSAASVLALMYQTGRHRLPTPVWCVWDDDRFLVFELVNMPPKAPVLLDAIEALARGKKLLHS
jgi:hypothetical protein